MRSGSSNAVSLLERVNKDPGPIPVLVVSGYDERQEPRMATEPFAAKLLKPSRLGSALRRDRGGPEESRLTAILLDTRGRRLRAALAAVLVRDRTPGWPSSTAGSTPGRASARSSPA
jgi:hypothetical protein